MSTAITPVPDELVQFRDMVCKYIHFDNLAHRLFKQVENARTMRKTLEQQIVRFLHGRGWDKSVIRVTQGELRVTQVKDPVDWSYKSIEAQLHNYFKDARQTDQTAQILAYMREHREVRLSESLELRAAANA